MRDNLDSNISDALLSGVLQPEDAPPQLRDLALLLSAARPAAMGEETLLEREVISSFAGAMIAPGNVVQLPASGRRHLLPKHMSVKIAAASAVLTLTGAAAAAATGSLPGGLQSGLASFASHVGISLPSPHHSGTGGANPVSGRGTTQGFVSTSTSTSSGSGSGSHATTTSDPTTGTTGSSAGGTGTTTGGSHPQSGPPVGADAHGLCTAYAAVTKDFTVFTSPADQHSQAFKRLQAAATAKGDSVKQYCTPIPPPGNSGHSQGNRGGGNGGRGQGNGGNGGNGGGANGGGVSGHGNGGNGNGGNRGGNDGNGGGNDGNGAGRSGSGGSDHGHSPGHGQMATR